jgi:AsmA protein
VGKERISRRSLFVILAAVLAGLLAVTTYRLLDSRRLLAGSIAAALGREVRLGTASIRPGLRPGFEVRDVVLPDSGEGSTLRDARFDRLDLEFALWPLVWGELRLIEVEVEGGRVVLQVAARSSATTTSGSASNRQVSVTRATARNVEIVVDRGDALQATNLERVTWDQERERQVHTASIRGSFGAIDFDLSGELDHGARAAEGSGHVPVTLSGTLAGAEISGSGAIGGSIESPSIELRLRAEASSLRDLEGAAGRELPPLGPVRASGALLLRDGLLGLTDLDVLLGNRDEAWLELTGHVGDLAHRLEYSLVSDFGFTDVRVLGPLVGSPPHIGPVAGRATVHNRSGRTSVSEFSLKGGREGVLEIDAEGVIEHLEGVEGLDARVDLSARDLAVVGELFRRRLPPIGPVELSGHIRGTERKAESEHLRLRLDRSHLEGSFVGLFPADRRPHLSADIRVSDLHLDDVGVEPRAESSSATSEPDATGSAARVLSDAPLALEALSLADGRLTFVAQQVIAAGGPLAHDVELTARLENGALSARHVSFHLDGGSVRGQLELDSVASPPTLRLEADAKGIQLGELLTQIDADEVYSGQVDARLALETRGVTTRILAAGVSGSVTVATGSGTIATEHARLLTRDLLESLRGAVGGSPPSETLNCAVVDLDFRDGVGVVRTFAIDAEHLLILGEGSIDLAAESLELRLAPEPRKASALSTAATVRLSGPITSPDISVEKTSLLTSSTRAVFENIGSATGLLHLWRSLRGGPSSRAFCDELLASRPR